MRELSVKLKTNLFINQQDLLYHTLHFKSEAQREFIDDLKKKKQRQIQLVYHFITGILLLVLVQIKYLYLNKAKLFICFNKHTFCTKSRVSI